MALLPLLTMGVLLVTAAQLMPLTGELIVVVMLCAAAVAGVIAVRSGASFDEIQRVTGERFAGVLPAVLILLAIGMLISTWVMSGTIPYLVFWGVRLVDPQYLALTAFLSTALMSSCTGTSWGSAGTIGVAMMGTAAAVGAPLPVIAGAVVSGAYFGDKMSPLSDSTIIAAVAADVDVYVHIRHMMYTAVPSFVIALAVYAIDVCLDRRHDDSWSVDDRAHQPQRGHDAGDWWTLSAAVSGSSVGAAEPVAIA